MIPIMIPVLALGCPVLMGSGRRIALGFWRSQRMSRWDARTWSVFWMVPETPPTPHQDQDVRDHYP